MKPSLVVIVLLIRLSVEDNVRVKIFHVDDGSNSRGGSLNTVEKIREIISNGRSEGDVLVVNTGTFTGGQWSGNSTKDDIKLLNDIGIDYSSFGHFGVSLDDVSGTQEFISNLNFPVYCLNFEANPWTNVKPSSIIKVNKDKQHSIGIIGYYTSHNRTDTNFKDVEETVRKEAKRLRLLEAKTIVAFGHSGLDQEENFGRNIDDVDIFIGGHSNRLDDQNNPIRKLYPMWIWDGYKKVYQPLDLNDLGEYIVRLELTLDTESGNILQANGSSVMGKELREDDDAGDGEGGGGGDAGGSTGDDTGSSSVLNDPDEPTLLVDFDGDGDVCRKGECNIGNFVTDALIDSVVSGYSGPGWTESAIAFIHAGMIKNGIPAKAVTKEDFERAIPERKVMVMITISGDVLSDVIKHPVRSSDSDGSEFLQYSGVRVYYDIRRRESQRVKNVVVRCSNCSTPKYLPIDSDTNYKVICPEDLARGDLGYEMIKEKGVDKKDLGSDIDMIMNYVKKFKYIWYVRERRIHMGGGTVSHHINYILVTYMLFNIVLFQV